MPSEISGIDITVPADRVKDPGSLADIFDRHCSKWVFQLERGDTGYEHFQGRLRLMKQKCFNTIKLQWSQYIPGCHVSITSSEVHHSNSFNYVMKEETRIQGPWSNEDRPKVLTRQMALFLEKELYPWQKEIEKLCHEWDDRIVHVILDPRGCIGKSYFAEYLEYKDLAYEVPPFTVMEDIMQCCMSIKPQKAYLIDMPRGLKKEKLSSFYAGIECLKNGVMYDKRYAFRKRRIDRPQIFIFTNCMPDKRLLSRDRWRFWTVSSLMNLVALEYDHEMPDVNEVSEED